MNTSYYKTLSLQYLLLLSSILFSFFLIGQTTETFTTSGSWVCPAGVTEVKVEAIGGGAGGRTTESTNGHTGGGGGGGAYAVRDAITVVPSTSYSFTVGSGGGASTAGNNSTATINGITITAVGGNVGGASGTSSTGGTGGASGSCVGDNAYSGGDGGGGQGANSGGWKGSGGGGGSGAGSSGAGNNGADASTITSPGDGGAVKANYGGAGGAGGYNTTGSNAPTTDGYYGGGGGGAGHSGNAGGTGRTGAFIFTYTCPETANAGSDQTLLECATSATLDATPAVHGTGSWSVVSGSATITNDSSPTTGITLTAETAVTLRWTITNEGCTSYDDVVITSSNTTPRTVTSDATNNTITCSQSVNLTLSAGDGTISAWQKSIDNSTWTDLAGTSNPINSDALSFNTYFRTKISGSCIMYTAPLLIKVVPTAGTVTLTSATPTCSGGTTIELTSATLSLTDYAGDIQWQESDDNGSSDAWANAVGGSGSTTDTYTTPTLTSSIYYRAKVTGAGCDDVFTTSLYVNPSTYNTGIKYWGGTGSMLTGKTSSAAFNTAGNWSSVGPEGTADFTGATAPCACDSLVIKTSSTVTLDISSSVTVGAINLINTSGTLSIEPNDNTLTVNGTFASDVESGTHNRLYFGGGNPSYDLKGKTTFSANSGDTWITCNGSGTGTMIIRGDFTQNPSTHSCSSNGATEVAFLGSTPQTYTISTNGSTFALGTTTTNIGDGTIASHVTFTGAGTTSPTVPGNLNIKAGSTLDLGTHTLNCTGTSKTFTMEANTTLIVRGNTGGRTGSNFPSGFTTYTFDPTSTVIYESENGVNQTIYAVGGNGYGNLTLSNSTNSGSSTKTAGNNLTIQGDLTINDAYTTFHGGTSLTHNIKGDWINNGVPEVLTYTTANTINFNGSNPQSIEGSSATTFYNLTNSNSNLVTLNQNISVTNTLNMAGTSNLNLNANNISLGTTGTLTGESNSDRIYDSAGTVDVSGMITATRDFNNTTLNIAGLGATITSTANLGSTEIKRGHLALEGVNSNTGIRRYYKITPTTTITGLDATLAFSYFDNELNGHTESNLTLWRTTDPTDPNIWTNRGGTVDAGAKTVTVTGIDAFSIWTAADEVNSPLPISLLSFTAQPVVNKVLLNWATASEQNNEYFTIEKTRDGITFEQVGTVKGGGNTTSTLQYSSYDYAPYPGLSYYRLKQTDYDGVSETFHLVTVEFIPAVSSFDFSIFPNPLPENNELTIKFKGETDKEFQILIHDVLGKLIYVKSVHLDFSEEIIIIKPFDLLIPGTYSITLTNGSERKNKRLVIR
jgi:hypothetical protein